MTEIWVFGGISGVAPIITPDQTVGPPCRELAPILERLQVAGATWVQSVAEFGRWFHRAVGQAGRMAETASRAGKHWFQGVEHARQAFT